MKKRLLAMIAALCMVVSMLGACGNTEEAATSKQDAAVQTQAAADESTAAETAALEEEEDLAEINMVYISLGPVPAGLQLVEDAINEITEAEINTHVSIEMIETGNYEQQISLKMSSQEKMDLMISVPVGAPSFNNMISQNQLMEISELLAEYAPETLELMAPYVAATSKGNGIYGLTGYRSLVASGYLCMRTDVLEDLGLLEKAQKMTTLTEYEEILEAVKTSEKWGHLAGIVASDGAGTALPIDGCYLGHEAIADMTVYDQLGDANKIIGINPDGSNPTIYNNFAHEEYKAMWTQMAEWVEKGYTYGDIAITPDGGETLVKNNIAFSWFCQSEIGVESAKKQTTGYDITCIKLVTLPVSTGSCTKFVWCVPNSATEPEAAVKMLNLMYTDARIANLLAWGIEGVNYQIKDGVATYIDGEDASTCTYHTADFVYGNQFLIYPWEGQSADFRQIAEAELKEGGTSAYLGFSLDTTVVSNELAAIINVLDEYRPSVDTGLLSAEDYDVFLAKLDSVGLQTVIAAYQEQLDAWLAAQ